jgi:hypothetical protein
MTILTDATEELRSLVLRENAEQEIHDAALSTIQTLAELPSSATATIHPLGFIQVKLATYEEFALRLHVWPVPRFTPQDPVWRVHRHGWLLRSYVLRGNAINYEYDVRANPGGEHVLYGVEYDRASSTLMRTPTRVSYAQNSVETHCAPAVYEVPSDAFHATVSASDEPTATFVVVYSEKESSPLVVGDADAEERYRFSRQGLSADDLEQAMNQLL